MNANFGNHDVSGLIVLDLCFFIEQGDLVISVDNEIGHSATSTIT